MSNNGITGSQLKKQLTTALKLGAVNQRVSDTMTDSWSPRLIATWKAELHAFHKDASLPNPLEDPELGE